jgi:hypothetical protein
MAIWIGHLQELLMRFTYCGFALGLLLAGMGVAAVFWEAEASPASGRGGAARPRAAIRSNTVVQAFPAKGFDAGNLPNPGDLFDSANYAQRDTVWVIDWDITNAQGGRNPPSSVLRITAAHFGYQDKDGNRKWITVAQNIALGEIFVPYDDASHQYEDIEDFHFRIRPADKSFLGPACLAPGEILKSNRPGMSGLVYKEVHDDGIRLIDNRTRPDRGRRGEKLVMWVNFYGDNYRYLVEYSFTDDGVIGCRVGGTAENLNDRQPAPRLADAHLHVGCWMFDPHLGDPTNPDNGGPDKNVVQLVRRVPLAANQPSGLFQVEVKPFPANVGQQGAAIAGSAPWVAEEFTVLRVQSTVRKNGSGHPQLTAYDLVTMRSGSCRSFPSPRFDYATHDYWVTPADPGFDHIRELPQYVLQHPGPVDGRAVRICHSTPLLHVARGEDFGPDGVSSGEGAAIVSWTGFMLKPRDLFDSTPLLPK